METKTVNPSDQRKPPRNPDHRRQTIWQIWVPLGFAILIILAMAVLAAISTGNNAPSSSNMASTAAIWLIIPVITTGLIFLSLLTLIIYGLAKLIKATPMFTFSARIYVFKGSAWVHHTADQIIQPIIKVNSALASWQTALTKLGLRRKSS